MAAAFLRRSVATAGLAVLATVASPLVGTALAATFTGSIGSDPAADSNGVVAANRPVFSANFSDNLASGSTITVKQDGTAVTCPQQIASNVVSCTPTADLQDGKDYVVTAHGIQASNHSVTADAPAVTFTVEYPTYDGGASIPVPGGTLIGGHEPLTISFDEPVGGNTNTFASDGAVKVFELITNDPNQPQCTATAPCRGNQLPGGISFPTTGLPAAPGNAAVFQPADTLVPGHYEVTTQVNGLDANGDDNPKAHAATDYFFWVNNAPPANLTSDGAAPNWVNNQNNTSVPFHGTAAPGESITVTVQDDSDDPSGFFWPSNSVVVPDCPTAPSCPWSVTVDVSQLANGSPVSDGTYAWDAEGFDGNSSGGSAIHTADVNAPVAQDIRIDTTAPNKPSVGSKSLTQTSNPDQTTLNLSVSPGVDPVSKTPDTDVTGYEVTVGDIDGHSLVATIGLSNQHVDITSLDDGALTIGVVAVDGAGNKSASTDASTSPTLTKNAGIKQDFANSSFVTPSRTVSFPDASTQSIQPPSKLAISFTQPVKLSYVDQTTLPNSTTHGTSVCVASPQGNCVVFASSPVLSNGDKTMTVDVPSKLADGGYTIKVRTYSKNLCPNKTFQNSGTWSCQSYNQVITVPGSAQLFTFHVDGTPPAAATISMPSKITPASVHTVGISGTAEPGSTLSLRIKSSGGGPTFIAGHGSPIVVDAVTGAWQTVEDLSSVRDGNLTVTAKEFDPAGNETDTTLSPQPVLAAHASKLTESVTGSVVTYGKGVLVSGRLVDQAGAPISGATITIKPRFDNGKYGAGQTATTNSTGHWSRTEFPAHNATWYATYAGTTVGTVHDAASIHTARTLVKVAIAFTSPRNHATVGSPVVLKGKVGPNKAGKTVSIYRHTSQGNVLLGKVKLDRHSHWSFKLTLPRGTTKLFAVIGRMSGNLGNQTRYLTITH